MITIVALGNPGEEYTHTRHNVGWLVMHEIIRINNLPSLVNAKKYTAEISEAMLHGKEVAILFPTTFMNSSGSSVKRYLDSVTEENELVVVHDEVDLPFGTIKISRDRGAGGHNGVKSIIETCGTKDFIRIRIGVTHAGLFGSVKRPTGEDLPKFVLGEFKPAELRTIPEIAEKVDVALKLYLEKGIEKAMQEVNTDI